MTQLNTPYPSTAFLAGFLRKHMPEVEVSQVDFSLELILDVFSKNGLEQIYHEILSQEAESERFTPVVEWYIENFELCLQRIPGVIHYLQGKDPTLGMRIVGRHFLPESPRVQKMFSQKNKKSPWIGMNDYGVHDFSKYLCSLFIDDLSEVVRDGIDSAFELVRYAEKISASASSFDGIQGKLLSTSLIDGWIDSKVNHLLQQQLPEVVALSAPFSGSAYGAFRIAKSVKEFNPKVKTVLGGGYASTELRELTDPRVFDYFDFVVLDDGEKPLQCLLETFLHKRESNQLLRTYRRASSGKVEFITHSEIQDVPFKNVGTPTYRGLRLEDYPSLLEMLNPMHRLWSEGRWNKLMVAHGCYWHRCTFCDTSLQYIHRYEPLAAGQVVDQMESLISETKQSGFHFVDEAAPPAALRAIAEEILRRKLGVSWWGNIRFEKNFTPELCELLARSGCIAVTGGLEVASDRILKRIQKGVSVKQVAQVTRAFSEAGILVHAYLMYGFPTQTLQETIDSLERVRQLFAASYIHSGFWHRFSVTAHSPIGKNPKAFGINQLIVPDSSFAKNDLEFTESKPMDWDALGEGLRVATYNYMRGVGFSRDLRKWFRMKVPKPSQFQLIRK